MKSNLILLAALALISTVVISSAQTTIDVNLDSVNANSGGVSAASLLATYGISLTNVSSGSVDIFSDTNITYLEAAPGNNFLQQSVGGSPNWVGSI
jgi:hypothetical protein